MTTDTIRPGLATRRSARLASLGRLGLRQGAAAAAHRIRRVTVSGERRQTLDDAFLARCAEDVAVTLGSMRGAAAKLGQLLSFLSDGVPEPVRDALASLQADVPPMAPEVAAAVIRNELGADPEELFARWEPTAVAAASIGQVHRAWLSDGTALAVKVQYPGIGDALQADMASAPILLRLLARAWPGLDPDVVAAELQARLADEVDYRIEASNQAAFGDFFADDPDICVPQVYPRYSTRRVLTTAWCDGARLPAAADLPVAERDRLGAALARFVFAGVFGLGACHGDPHPGNFLVDGDGRMVALDFGLVRWLAPAEVDSFAGLIDAVASRDDPAPLRAALVKAGLLDPQTDVSDAEVVAAFGTFSLLLASRGPRTVDAQSSAELVRRSFGAGGDPVLNSARLPAPYVVLQRAHLGLVALLGRLGATADWPAIAATARARSTAVAALAS